MTTQKPTPLRIGGRVTSRRVNELVEARVLDIAGDGLITVSRVGERVTIGLNLHKLWASLPKPPRAMKGRIKARSAATGLPAAVTYDIGFDAGVGDPSLTFEDKTPWYRPVDAVEIAAAEVGSECLVIPGRDEDDKPTLDLILCSEQILTEACSVSLASSPLPTHAEALLFDAYGRLLLTTDQDPIYGPAVTELEEANAIRAILIDAYGAPILDAYGRYTTGNADTLEAYVEAIRRIATDAYGNTMLDTNGSPITLAA